MKSLKLFTSLTQVRSFIIIGTIHKINTNLGWYYESFNICWKKMKNLDGKLMYPQDAQTLTLIIQR